MDTHARSSFEFEPPAMLNLDTVLAWDVKEACWRTAVQEHPDGPWYWCVGRLPATFSWWHPFPAPTD